MGWASRMRGIRVRRQWKAFREENRQQVPTKGHDGPKVPAHSGLGSRSAVTLAKASGAHLHLPANDVKDKDPFAVVAVEHATWRFNDLAIAEAAEFPWHGAAFWMSGKLFHVREDPLYQAPSGFRVIESDVISDGIKIAQGGFGPNYFSHRDIRVLASACESVRPSSMARSPRAMPWNTARRL